MAPCKVKQGNCRVPCDKRKDSSSGSAAASDSPYKGIPDPKAGGTLYPTVGVWQPNYAVQAEVLHTAGPGPQAPHLPGVVQGVPVYPLHPPAPAPSTAAPAGAPSAHGSSTALHPYCQPPPVAAQASITRRTSCRSTPQQTAAAPRQQRTVYQRQEVRGSRGRQARKVATGFAVGAVAGVLCCFGIPVLL